MNKSEDMLASNLQTLRECTGKGPWIADTSNPCEKAFTEVMNFMRQDGPIQEALKSRGLVKINGDSLEFDQNLYPKQK